MPILTRSLKTVQTSKDATVLTSFLAVDALGRDHLTQTEPAVRAVCRVRPDIPVSEALTAVELVRRS